MLTALGSGPHVVFIAGACLFWAAFVLVRARQDRHAFRAWGFCTGNLGPATAWAGLVLVVAAAGMALVGRLQGTLRMPAHLLPLLVVYPAWGLIQQFLALGIVVSNLERLPFLGSRKALLVLLAAALFGLVHVKDVRLAGGTFLLELVVVPLYLRWRNLWPLGVLHGWLGGLFYLWVLKEDLWAEAVRMFG